MYTYVHSHIHGTRKVWYSFFLMVKPHNILDFLHFTLKVYLKYSKSTQIQSTFLRAQHMYFKKIFFSEGMLFVFFFPKQSEFLAGMQ